VGPGFLRLRLELLHHADVAASGRRFEESSMERAPVIIVTGGTRGIGRCIVERLHRDGYGVLFTHSGSPEDARAIVAALDRANRPCRGLQLDVAVPDAPAAIFDAAEALGEVCGLVNNAGITGTLGPITQLTDDALARIVAVNLVAPTRLCREAATRWRGRDSRTTIVNISSIAARTGSPGEYVAYAATKAGLDALTVGLAKELAPSNIHVNAVSPGTIDTTIHARAGEPARAARVAARIPLQRPGQPEEIANAVAWLVSAEASYVTGSVVSVAGGL
jgi:NAD(P)-dependent dehydrogenase (short-subunit alcohol dehydrogenase family)